MLYVYYKFHMQCVNQQKGRKTVVLLQLRYDEEKKSESKIYIYQTKQTNIHDFLFIDSSATLISVRFDKVVS